MYCPRLRHFVRLNQDGSIGKCGHMVNAMGFKTFNNYFEEVYDLDRDPDVRMNTIVDVCDRLRDAPWQDMYLQSQALRQYNFDIFFNEEKLGEQVNKTLNLFLEFADGGQVPS